MASLRSLINGLLGNTNSVSQPSQSTGSPNDPSNFIPKNIDNLEALTKKMAEIGKKIKETAEDIDVGNVKFDELKKHYGENHSRTQEQKLRLQRLSEQYRSSMREEQKTPGNFAKQNGLSNNELKDILEEFDKFGNDYAKQIQDAIENNKKLIEEQKQFLDNQKKVTASFKDTRSLLNKNFNNISGDINNFFQEFGWWGALIAEATNRMIKMNTKLVEHNRKMGGTFSNEQLGMDLYGNSTAGNIDTITAGNNIDMQTFLASQQIFKTSKIGFTDTLNDQAEELRNYGLEVGKLSKFYGVEVGTINQISGNLLYGYGVKIKDLGSILEEGKEKAVAAGVSVQDYFAKLKDATESLGEYYIAGGIKGMENLALYAAKTDTSVKSILGYTEKFKDFTSQFSQQNKASQLGLQSASIMMSKVWGLSQLGRQQEATALMSTSLTSDLRNNGGFDRKTGDINQKGISSLQALGIDQSQIAQIQKLNKVWIATGVTAEQQLNIDKQSLDVKTRVAQYEKQNATVGERLNSLWTKLKGLVLDPLQDIFAPILNTALDVLVGAVNVLSFVLKPITYGFGKIGELLTWVSKKISDAITWVTSRLDNLGFKFEKSTGVIASIGKAAGVAVAGLMAIGIFGSTMSIVKGGLSRLLGGSATKIATNMVTNGGKSLLSRSANAIPNLVKTGGRSLLSGVKGIGSGWKALGGMGKAGFAMKGSILGLAGSLLGSAVGGKGGDTISNISQGAALGAMLGPIGAAVGAGLGLVYSSMGKIGDVWSDSSKNILEKLGGTVMALCDTLGEAGNALWDKVKEWGSDIWHFVVGKDMSTAVKDGVLEAQGDKNKYNGNLTVQRQFTDTAAQVTAIMNQRVVTNAYESSKIQEKLIEKQTPTKLTVNVNPSIYGNAPKQLINQF